MNIYNQIVEVITEAIFGSGAELTANQLFHVEQLSLWMSMFVLLLPFIAILGIVVKMFK